MLQFILDHWVGTSGIGVALLELLLRLIPSEKPRGIIQTIFNIINFIIPNIKKQKPAGEPETPKTTLMGKKVTHLILVFLLVGGAAQAQIWQNFRGVRLVNEIDTTSWARVPGAIAFDQDDTTLYLFHTNKWHPLNATASSAGLTTADNGLQVNPAGNVRQGGSFLAGTTTLSVPTGAGVTYDLAGTNATIQWISPLGYFIQQNNPSPASTSIIAGSIDGAVNTYGFNIDPDNQFGFGAGASFGVWNSSVLPISSTAFTPTSITTEFDNGTTDGLTVYSGTGITNVLTNGLGDQFSYNATDVQATLRANLLSVSENYQFTAQAGDARMIATSGGTTNNLIDLFDRVQVTNTAGVAIYEGSAGLTLFRSAGGPVIFLANDVGDGANLQTQDGATGTTSTGDILLRTGFVTSGTGDVGDIQIRLGSQAGSGTGGQLVLDPTNGFLVLSNLPTSNPCGTAPSGTVWSNSNVLTVCP